MDTSTATPPIRRPFFNHPTVGKHVRYHPAPNDFQSLWDMDEPMSQLERKLPFAATIVYVHNDRLVNLVVFDHEGNAHRRPKVALVPLYEPFPTGDDAFATWTNDDKSVGKTE